ncbi:MAG: universal stress protein [Rhodospirillales bacterium]|nr:universal stress protein [Rhodospirillales bacterium]MCW8860831.1 universal stress protein [Rhodospirillales bacterium]MCW8952414.1 universal stress protein [Rhodospirillales bacterium]MCW8970787.1 universal stress protein [Rhodospirillales bacterium]MCW9001399.1 universal stress protein [Rhodospirillales bacterium]
MYKELLLCVDLQDEASMRKAMRICVEYARAFGSRLNVLTVVPEFGFALVEQYFPKGAEKKIIDDAKAALHAVVKEEVPGDIKVRHIVAQGSVYDNILSMAEKEKADLIVVTAHRPGLKDYLLGPNAARVVRHAECSVLVVRA